MAKNKKKKQHRFWWFVVKFQVFCLCIVATALGVFYFGGYVKDLEDLKNDAIEIVSKSNRDTFKPGQSSTIYDCNGQVISQLRTEKRSEYAKYVEIPKYFEEAMISIEDKKFMTHNGVDYKAFFRAGTAFIQKKKITQGGSTITMQLSKNIFLDSRQTVQRKLKEIFISMRLEKLYTKQDIMEFYLNNVYFANGYYGVKAASKGYFNCDMKDLSLSQVAFLCAIPNSPTYYDPVVNPNHTITRRNLILKNMYEDKVISKAEYDKAIAEQITLNRPESTNIKKNSSLDTYSIYCATRALMEKQGFEFKTQFSSDFEQKEYNKMYEEAYNTCQKELYAKGYKIYTSFDLNKQEELQNSVDEGLKSFGSKTSDGVYEMQSAAVCIDNKTGYVVAMVGGRKQESTSYTLNRAFQSFRQPGSSIKPLVVYTPAFEKGYGPESVINDHKFEGGPSNSGGGYYGNVTIREAVARSLNTVAWQIYDDITPKAGLSYIRNMKFSRIKKSDETLATALGGFTIGVSPVEMASGYCALENDGAYRQPTCIVKIENPDGKAIYESKQIETVIYKQNAARMMTDVLTEGFKVSYGTTYGLGLDNGMPCAAKTGTTNDKKDGWFCGYTRYYTTAIWVGYDKPRSVSNLYGGTYPGKIWKAFMNKIHKGLEIEQFPSYTPPTGEVKGLKKREEVQTEQPSEEETGDENEVTSPDDANNQDNQGTPEVPKQPDTQQNGDTTQPSNSSGDGNSNTNNQGTTPGDSQTAG
ncbi:transglycosylase domain-containing protein [Lachnobacterium bovis]|uniref:Penicillin-binding protein 1A n=1 Tax=Lachnobacterium bovis TaxID=140626 RepID=A0A1H9RVA9_9FIRM|nr:PBP1A family penicillin-binding protein [Lachnobacterium bovis]SER76544.1 penicillin-binding protein, 1A family [Lachnobacterium bovis]